MREKTVVLSLKGVFYQAYGKDAMVLHNLTGYKLTKQRDGETMCGFPENVIGKVCALFREKKVSLTVLRAGKEKIPDVVYDEQVENSAYDEYLQESDNDRAIRFLSNLCSLCKTFNEQSLVKAEMKLDLTNKETVQNFYILLGLLEGGKKIEKQKL